MFFFHAARFAIRRSVFFSLFFSICTYRYSVRVILLLLFVIIIIFRYYRRFRRRENRFVSGFTEASSRHDFTVMSRRRHRRRYVKPEQFRAYDRVHLPHVITICRSTPYTTPFMYLTTKTYILYTLPVTITSTQPRLYQPCLYLYLEITYICIHSI